MKIENNYQELYHSFKEELNEKQLEVVMHLNGPLLVLAGAGSGKTRVITYRVKMLIARGIPAENILCITFTNKAAKEMKERIMLMNSKMHQGVTISTFHALSLSILKKYASFAGYFNGFSLYDANDQKDALFRVLKEMKLDLEENDLKEVQSYISNAKNKMLLPKDLQDINENNELVGKIYEKYQEFLFSHQAMDFDDLLFYTVKIFKENENILSYYRKKFGYVMIDEYQDTNKSQYEFIHLLCNGNQVNLMVVGDDDQSIYSWRGAELKNILEFEKNFPDMISIKLEDNYRSTENILKVANHIIKHNEERQAKQLKANFEKGRLVKAIEYNDPFKEAEEIANEINGKRFKYNVSYGNFAIIYRTKYQSKPIETIFLKKGIPFKTWGTPDLYDKKEIKDILAFMKLMIDKNDDLSFLRIINKPVRIREDSLEQFRQKSLELHQSCFSLIDLMLENEVDINFLKENEKRELEIFRDMIIGYQNIDNHLEEIFRRFLLDIGYINFLEITKEKDNIKEKRFLALEHFFQILLKYEKNTKKKGKDISIKDFLLKLMLFRSNEKSEDDEVFREKKVNLMTIHSAKGLEFPYLYIIGFEEKIIPFQRENEPILLDEERRLCYVAITRAQKECTLTLCSERNKNGKKEFCNPSRFLQEIPDEYIIRDYGRYHIENLDKKENQRNIEKEKEKSAKIAFSKLKSLF